MSATECHREVYDSFFVREKVIFNFSSVLWNLLKVTSTAKQKILKMCHLRHRLRIFLFPRKFMFCSQDIQVFVILAIP